MSAKSTDAKNETKLDKIPKEWPGAYGLYKYSKQAVQPNLWNIVGLYVVAVLLNMVFGNLKNIGGVLQFLLAAYYGAALVFIWLAGTQGKVKTVQDSLKDTYPVFIKYLVLQILVGLLIGASLLLLIIPFFFVYPRLALAQYYLIDKKMGIMDAINASWNNTKGYSVKVWTVTLAQISMALLALTIIGIPFAIYFLVMYSAAMAVLYKHIEAKS
jgi:membrane-anchored glycerophosphoryl diester phosphodiesterase (GDPDase)